MRDAETGANNQLTRYVLLIGLLGGALALALGLLVWQAVTGDDSPSEEDGSSQPSDTDDEVAAGTVGVPELEAAESTAREFLIDLSTYDYQDLDELYDWLDQIADENVRESMSASQDDFTEIVRQSQATAQGEVVDSAYRANSDGSVTVLAFVRQTITDQQSTGYRLSEQWATLVLKPGDDGWAIHKVDLADVPQAATE